MKKAAIATIAMCAAAPLLAVGLGTPLASADWHQDSPSNRSNPHRYKSGPDTSVYNGGPNAETAKPNWMRHYTSYKSYTLIVDSGHLGVYKPTGSCPQDNCTFLTPDHYTNGADARHQLALPGWNDIEGYIPVPPGQAMPPGQRGTKAEDLPPGQQRKGYDATGQIAGEHFGEKGGGIEYSKKAGSPSPSGKPVSDSLKFTITGRGFKWVPVIPSPALPCAQTNTCPDYNNIVPKPPSG